MADPEALLEPHNEHELLKVFDWVDDFDESIRTVVPADHFLEDEHHNSNQLFRRPLGSSPPPPSRLITPQAIPFVQVVTRAGRVVNPPEHFCIESYAAEASMRDAPPRPPSPKPQSLEGLDWTQWANWSVLPVDEP